MMALKPRIVSLSATYLPGDAGEHFRHVERLRQEALDLARAVHGLLVLFRQLVHAEDRDDVLQLLVALEHRLHAARGVVVVLADHQRIELAARGVERVHRRIDAERCDLAREHDGRIQVRESRRRRRIGQVVRGHVDRLHGGDRSGLGRGDALLEHAHLFRERRLVAHRARHAAEQRGHFRSGQRVAVDVVDEEQHVAALAAGLLLVAEVLRHGQAGERRRAGGCPAARSSGRTPSRPWSWSGPSCR